MGSSRLLYEFGLSIVIVSYMEDEWNTNIVYVLVYGYKNGESTIGKPLHQW